MSKLYFVVTEEGVEGSGQKTPLAALIEYIEFGEVGEFRINEILSGKSEISHVEAYTKTELNAMVED